MQMSGVPSVRQDLSALSLDAALQLDLIERRKDANTQVLVDFLDGLRSINGSSGSGDALSLSGQPQNVEIFNWALHQLEAESVKDVPSLEKRVAEFFHSMQDVTEGKKSEGIGALKAFCLSLHQALLNEYSPFKNEDDWVLTSDERFA